MHAIEVVVDVRSNPYSRYATHFTGTALKPLLIKAGFKYLFMGKEIGGKPTDPQFLDDEGYVSYEKVARSPLFIAGLDRLCGGAEKYKVAVMCGEENPSGCHRRNLIGAQAQLRGMNVIHIRKGGELQSEDELRLLEDPEPDVTQLTLF